MRRKKTVKKMCNQIMERQRREREISVSQLEKDVKYHEEKRQNAV